MASFFSSRRLPKKIRFDPEVARRVVPGRLVERGLVANLEEGKHAVELVISISEKEDEVKARTAEKND